MDGKMLDMVDEWKLKLYEKLKDLTPEQEAAFWEKAHDKGLAARPSKPARRPPAKRKGKERRRASA